MYNIIPLILILLSVGVIVFIIVRKFPVLSNVDVENIPEEKEKRFKEKIISNRLKRSVFKWSSKLIRLFGPIWRAIGNFFKWLWGKLHEMKEGYKKEPVLKRSGAPGKINELFEEAEDLMRNNNYEEGEKKLIEIINLDNKNIEAFKRLGSLYLERKNFNEAAETFKHVLKLTGGNDGEIYFDLSLARKETGDLVNALVNINSAMEFEPSNPRYLDTLLDISIMNKDKVLALKAYKKLKEVNPENQKLSDLKREIEELS
jgi:tetratricopeptide (TPR) repeat protein